MKRAIKIWLCRQCGKHSSEEAKTIEDLQGFINMHSDEELDIYLKISDSCQDCD